MRERVKELRCVYAASSILANDLPLDQALGRVVDVIPPGWQYPEITVAMIALDGRVHASDGFGEGVAAMVEPVTVDGKVAGRIEVRYLEPSPPADEGPFLGEERMLLRALAERVGETVARQRAGERLRRREAHFRTLVESATDLILVLDRDLRIVYASPSAPSVCGFSPTELEGERVATRLHPDDERALSAMYEEAVGERGAVRRLELRIRHKDGGWRHLDVAARNLLHDPDIQGLLVVARDATERKRLEDELRQAQKMEAVGRLAGGIAHDFNNLLTVISVQGELLAEGLPEGDPRRDELDEIRRAAHNGAALTRQLLAFGRRQVVKPVELEPGRVVADLERMVGRVLGEDIELVTEIGADAGAVRIDPGQLEQMLLNLVINARDAMPRGGRLRIATRRVKVPPEEPDLPAGAYVEVEVTDTGTGMKPQVAEHVFEPFYTTKRGGTGLGLSTVYGIVKQNGGDVRVHSVPGEGTSFRLHLPRVSGPVTTRPAPVVPSTRPHRGRETVLLVEDDEVLRRTTRRVLGRRGYTVLEAANGPGALRVSRSHDGPIHLLLSDVIMPDMSGPELASALRTERPDMAVLLSSGYSGDEVTLQWQLAPDTPFLEKPFTPSALATAVREALDGAPAGG